MTPVQLAHDLDPSTTDHTESPHFLLLQSREVDLGMNNSPRVLVNNTIFHVSCAAHHRSTVPCASVHAKGFLHTIPCPCLSEDQSKMHEGDYLCSHLHHTIQKHCRISMIGEQYQCQVYGVDNTCSQTTEQYPCRVF